MLRNSADIDHPATRQVTRPLLEPLCAACRTRVAFVGVYARSVCLRGRIAALFGAGNGFRVRLFTIGLTRERTCHIVLLRPEPGLVQHALL